MNAREWLVTKWNDFGRALGAQQVDVLPDRLFNEPQLVELLEAYAAHCLAEKEDNIKMLVETLDSIAEALGLSKEEWADDEILERIAEKEAELERARQLLTWVFDVCETNGFDLGEYAAATDLTEQVREYKCHGCNGTGSSRWPLWSVQFIHEPDCWYKAAIAEKGTTHDQG